MPPVGLAVAALVVGVAAMAPAELRSATVVVAVGGFKPIGWEFVMFGFATVARFGGTTFTLMNGGLQFAYASAWSLVSKDLSRTFASRPYLVRRDRRAALRFRPP